MQGAKVSKKKAKKVTTKKKHGKQNLKVAPKEPAQNDYGMDQESNKKIANHQKVKYFVIKENL
jgi:hypothetical protein